MPIGENISKLRRMADMTQTELAIQLGKSKATVNHYEKGRTIPPLVVRERMAKIFQIQLEDIIREGASSESVSLAIRTGRKFMVNRQQVITFDQLILERLTAIDNKLDSLDKKK